MIRKKQKVFFLISFILLTSVTLYGCNKIKQGEQKKLDIAPGAVALEAQGDYKVYNLENNKYEKLDIGYTITSYDLKSGSYIYNDNDNYKARYLDSEQLIGDGKNVISPKLSNEGEYVAYFTNNNFLELKIRKLSENKDISINSNVFISGTLMDWLDKDTIIYYGIDGKENGIFSYNLSTNEEKLLYKLDLGYIGFLKVLDKGIVFTQDKLENTKYLNVIDKNGQITSSIENFEEVKDVKESKGILYILGKLKNNNYSLYKYSNNNLNRLVFDFPESIDLESGLSNDKDGNVIFAGYNDEKKENIYKYQDDNITALDGDEGKYNFINVK